MTSEHMEYRNASGVDLNDLVSQLSYILMIQSTEEDESIERGGI